MSDIKYDLVKDSYFERAEISFHLEILFTFWFCIHSENQEQSDVFFMMTLGLCDYKKRNKKITGCQSWSATQAHSNYKLVCLSLYRIFFLISLHILSY